MIWASHLPRLGLWGQSLEPPRVLNASRDQRSGQKNVVDLSLGPGLRMSPAVPRAVRAMSENRGIILCDDLSPICGLASERPTAAYPASEEGEGTSRVGENLAWQKTICFHRFALVATS